MPRSEGSSASVQLVSAVRPPGPVEGPSAGGGACAQAGATASETAPRTSADKALFGSRSVRMIGYAHQHARATFGALAALAASGFASPPHIVCSSSSAPDFDSGSLRLPH